MAHNTAGLALGLFYFSPYLEVKQLNQLLEQVPASHSLLELVKNLYSPENRNEEEDQTLELSELLGYLNNIESCEHGTLNAILNQTEEIGDPGLPSNDQQAIFMWLDEAFLRWQTQFPVEQPLASELSRLQPLAAALAVSEPSFLTPGTHNFHLLLDTLHESAVGWQKKLGRAGQSVERELKATVEKSRGWWSDDSADLGSIYDHVAKRTDKAHSRAKKMSQRAIETEQGRLKILQAKTLVARMINSLLKSHLATPEIASFLKGPWYESGQLVMLRFGADSKQWAAMSKVTESLVLSLQSQTADSGKSDQKGNHRQKVFTVITKLPRELRRWLLALQHDEDSINQAIDAIERTHMAVLRQQGIDLVKIDPIPLDSMSTEEASEATLAYISKIEPGQWFIDFSDRTDPLRMQLALILEPEKLLLFTNQAGIKVKLEGFSSFFDAIEAGNCRALYHDSTFSRALIAAAKSTIKSEAEKARTELESRKIPAQSPATDSQSIQAEVQSAEDQEQLQREYDAANKAKLERQKIRKIQREQAVLDQRKKQKELDDKFLSEQAETQRTLREQAEARRRKLDKEAAEHLRNEEYQQRKRERERTREALLSIASESASMTHGQQRLENEFNLSTGTWVGFHDGATPLLAKLAVHDKDGDVYTFVNRTGVKQRELGAKELGALMERGLVDVIQTRSTFREEVIRKQNKHKN